MGFSVPCTSSFSELPFNAIQSLQTQSSTPTWVWVYIGSTSSFVPFPCDVRAVRLDAAARVRSMFHFSADARCGCDSPEGQDNKYLRYKKHAMI
jgi:hypothetical protein